MEVALAGCALQGCTCQPLAEVILVTASWAAVCQCGLGFGGRGCGPIGDKAAQGVSGMSAALGAVLPEVQGFSSVLCFA